MAGLKWLTKQLPRLEGKRVAAVALGASPAESPECKETLEKLFKPLPQVRGFYWRTALSTS